MDYAYNECSTPFGIKGYCAFPTIDVRYGWYMCSTPFGIKGYCAWVIGPMGRSSSCAQRLSASKVTARRSVLARSTKSKGAQRLSASKVTAPRRRQHEGSAMTVLNAFRHQRLLRASVSVDCPNRTECSTPFGIKGYCAGGNNQLQQLYFKCSTPFGIKGYCARRNRNRNPQDGRVLNAFRHQRLLRVMPGTASPLSLHVLNAFRHQRLLRALAVQVLLQGFLVLNAFRHQRLLRLADGPLLELLVECSTPFGIKGYCAQRGAVQSDGRYGVLNAFRHQRLLRCGAVWCKRWPVSAQRLSASKVTAPST